MQHEEGVTVMADTRDRMMAVYEGRRGRGVVFQPRIKHWFEVNAATGTLPPEYRGKYLDEVYQDLGVTPREVWGPGGAGSEFAGYFALDTREGDDVEVWVRQARGLYEDAAPQDYVITEYRTPVGSIQQIQRRTEHGTSLYNVEYYLKDVKDLEVYAYILRERRYAWNQHRYEWGAQRFGDQLALRVQLPRSPLLWLMVGSMGFQRTVIMLWRHRREMEEVLGLLEEQFYRMLEACQGKPVVELSFGDNMHQDMCSPPHFQRYVLPFYQRIMPKIHGMGMYATSHWDGFVKQLLPLVRATGLDGLECVTPVPQGDVTLEEMQAGMTGMFLRDGIPAVFLCPWTPLQTLEDHVTRLLHAFYPRLILGISDLVPANAAIERIRFVKTLVEEFNASL